MDSKEKNNNDEFLKVVKETFEKEEKAFCASEKTQKQSNFHSKPLANSYPPLVQIGITNACNLECRQCYHRKYKKGSLYQQFFMEENLFKKVVDEIKTFPDSTILRLLGKGESLIHPAFLDMMRYAKANLRQPIALITNGLALNTSINHSVLEIGIDIIDISLDAFTAGTYGAVRNGPLNLPLITTNVENLIYQRNQGKYNTKIIVSFLLQPENYHELDMFKEYWGERVDKILYRKYHTYSGKISSKPSPYKERIPCPALWNRININERGFITQCFVDWDDERILVNLNQPGISILQIWRSEKLQRIRDNHFNTNYDNLCRNCEGWQTAHWTLSYENVVHSLGGRHE